MAFLLRRSLLAVTNHLTCEWSYCFPQHWPVALDVPNDLQTSRLCTIDSWTCVVLPSGCWTGKHDCEALQRCPCYVMCSRSIPSENNNPRFWFVPEFAFPWDARNATSLSPLHFPFLQVLLHTCFVPAPGMTAATCCHYACPSPRGSRHAHFIFAGVFVLGPS